MSGDSDQRAPAGMVGIDPLPAVADNYREFARVEAAGRSPAYEQLAYAVAEDVQVLAFLHRLQPPQRQPNLLFAAARFLLGAIPEPQTLRALVTDRASELAAVMTTRRTQTNEAARCAVLAPALAMLPGPLALLEVGAAAGLTLLPDLYSYDYGAVQLASGDPEAPVLACRPSDAVPLPSHIPEVVWRAGIDLNPLDTRDADDLAWLECLIWPGEPGRSERLRAAAAVARRHPPVVHRGDLLDDLPQIAGTAPKDATLVIYHTAVLTYVDVEKRRAFADAVGRLDAIWLSNEGPRVLPGTFATTGQEGFALIRDGKDLIARTDPHGTWIDWTETGAESPMDDS